MCNTHTSEHVATPRRKKFQAPVDGSVGARHLWRHASVSGGVGSLQLIRPAFGPEAKLPIRQRREVSDES